MTADRDDLAAIMDAHIYCESARGPWRWCSCGLGRDANGAYSPAQHRAHVAQMVLESDWLRGVRADARADLSERILTGHWPECKKGWKGYCTCPADRGRLTQDRADRVDAEDTDNTTDRT